MAELKAYCEGIVRKAWLIGLIALCLWWGGGWLADIIVPEYTASTSILLNDRLLTTYAFPSNIVQLDLPINYSGMVLTPAALGQITKAYPYYSETQLTKKIFVVADQTNQVLLINVTDSSPEVGADIANFLAQNFIRTQTASLHKQMDYYQRWQQATVTRLNTEIDTLNQRIASITPQLATYSQSSALSSQQKIMLDQYQAQVDLDRRILYSSQKALTELQQIRSLITHTYIVLKPATTSQLSPPLIVSGMLLQISVTVLGLCLLLCMLITMDFFSPAIRHKEELCRLLGIYVLVELPHIFKRERKRILSTGKLPYKTHLKSLRLLTTFIGATAIRRKGQTIVFTNPHHQNHYAAIVAASLAQRRLKILLIDGLTIRPDSFESFPITHAYPFTSSQGRTISLVSETMHPNLFLLSPTTVEGQVPEFTSTLIVEFLPELQKEFDLIILEAPPLDQSDTHLLLTKAEQVLLLVKKRRDTLKTLQSASATCAMLQLKPQYIFTA